MRIIRNDQLATWTFVPVETGEQETLDAIARTLSYTKREKLVYGGREEDGQDRRFLKIHLFAGAHKAIRTRMFSSHFLNDEIYLGCVELVLCGSSDKDKHEVGCIRNICFVSSCDLIFLDVIWMGRKRCLLTTAKYCKFCGATMIDFDGCYSGVCNYCAEKCEHLYCWSKAGSDREFCVRCCRIRPREGGENWVRRLVSGI